MDHDEQTAGRARPSGRRAGDSGTRAAILVAARDLFSSGGYDKVSVRAIAARAGVDPGLIRHFFGDKAALFAVVSADRTTIPQRLAAALTGKRSELGLRVASEYLSLWEDDETAPILLAVVRTAVTTDDFAGMLLDVLGPQLPDSGSSVQSRRLALAGSQLLGIALGRYVAKAPPLTSMTRDELAAQVAPSIQRYFDEG